VTPPEIKIATALGNCSFAPGSWDKRFCRSMAAMAKNALDIPMTERQRVHLLRLVHKYRRQMPTKIIEIALDESVVAADRRVAAGLGALADFTPRRSRREETPSLGVASSKTLGCPPDEAPQLSLF
jgi:hypothetical protein